MPLGQDESSMPLGQDESSMPLGQDESSMPLGQDESSLRLSHRLLIPHIAAKTIPDTTNCCFSLSELYIISSCSHSVCVHLLDCF